MATHSRLNDSTILRLVQIALAEDVGDGDLTCEALVNEDDLSHAVIVAKERGVIAGTVIAGLVFGEIDRGIVCEWQVEEGALVEPGTILAHIHGPTRGILTAERTALNFLQRMSGVASATRRYVEEVTGTGARILDTRKTIPGWRTLDKYAVEVGGGINHRMGLFDMVMIKDNHIAAHGTIAGAVAAVLRYFDERGITGVGVEVETTNLDQVSEAVSLEGVTRIMLDNFPIDLMRDAVNLINGRVKTEASGGITLRTVRDVAHTGVDYISIGAITHSAPALDISLDVQGMKRSAKVAG